MDQLVKKIAQAFNQRQLKWGIGASKLLSYFQITSIVNDLDLVVDLKDHDIACNLLKEMGKEIEVPNKEEYTTERFSRFMIDGIEIDLMSDFKIIHEGGIFTFSMDSDLVNPIIKEDHTIYLTSLEQWYIAYLLMKGRDKKIRMLEEYFSNHLYNRTLLKSYYDLSFSKEIKTRIEKYME